MNQSACPGHRFRQDRPVLLFRAQPALPGTTFAMRNADAETPVASPAHSVAGMLFSISLQLGLTSHGGPAAPTWVLSQRIRQAPPLARWTHVQRRGCVVPVPASARQQPGRHRNRVPAWRARAQPGSASRGRRCYCSWLLVGFLVFGGGHFVLRPLEAVLVPRRWVWFTWWPTLKPIPPSRAGARTSRTAVASRLKLR
jgi:hypothetical protein